MKIQPIQSSFVNNTKFNRLTSKPFQENNATAVTYKGNDGGIFHGIGCGALLGMIVMSTLAVPMLLGVLGIAAAGAGGAFIGNLIDSRNSKNVDKEQK